MQRFGIVVVSLMLATCGTKTQSNESIQTKFPIVGTWRLLTGTTVEKGDTTITDYTRGVSFIKIINDTHFAFLKHDLNGGKGPAGAYDAGGGSYTLADSLYTEHLEYYTDRQWEGHDFTFTVMINNDTLVQQGIEKVPGAGVDRLNIERYVRVKK